MTTGCDVGDVVGVTSVFEDPESLQAVSVTATATPTRASFPKMLIIVVEQRRRHRLEGNRVCSGRTNDQDV